VASQCFLIVGLGNPGPQYEHTRHNAGFWFVERLAQQAGARFKHEQKFHGELSRVVLNDREVVLLKPTTFMNRSGQAVRSVAHFYRIEIGEILVAHDELDLPAGVVRLKIGGGHAGHNGLRDIIAQMGGNEFLRLRIGIGRPLAGGDVADYVLHPAGKTERAAIGVAIGEAVNYAPKIIGGELQSAMNHLHRLAPSDTAPPTSD
jgi:PTH1 family peptidyl-tRNA hydrolase